MEASLALAALVALVALVGTLALFIFRRSDVPNVPRAPRRLRYSGYFSLYPFVFTFSMFNYDFTHFRCPFLDTVPINLPFFHISPAHFGYAILLQ
jgi:hypothetical protein